MDEQVVTPEVQEVATPQQEPQATSGNDARVDKSLWVMRKKLEAEEEARKAAERRAYEMEQRLQQHSTPTPSVEEDDLAVDNEEYVQAKHIKNSNKKIKSKLSATEQKIAELEQKLAYFEAKVDTDSLKDFNKVVSDENLRTLALVDPDGYQTIMSNPNLKAKSKTAYNLIKYHGIADQTDSRDSAERISANKQKPQAAALASPQAPATPLSRLNDYDRRILTEADRDRILAEVERKKRMW